MRWQPKTERCAFLVDNLDLEEAAGVPGARWEAFQLSHLDYDGMFGIEAKSRQIAWSWLVAAEAVATGILSGEGTIFVSINLDEAKEKIRYASQIIEVLPRQMRPRLLTDNRTELEFANGARLISLPGTPPRGKARFHIALDEYAHSRNADRIYTGALPIISKGNRRLRIGSSPMGASGRFWEIFTQKMQPYPGYRRKSTPWWEVQAFCTNVREARILAPGLPTAQRVELFGADRIQVIFANMPLEDFQQEFECDFVDQATAWITWEEIAANQVGIVCHAATCYEKEVDSAFATIDALRVEIEQRRVEHVFGAGVDVGRTRNTSELFLVGQSTTDTFPLRLMVTMDNVSFDDQKSVLRYALDMLPISKMFIDRNGIGMNLAEDLERLYPVKVEGVQFTQPNKVLWATDTKMRIQQGKTPLPVHKDLAYQIHSVKRIVSSSKNLIFDTERNEKHHADKFWAWALALSAATQKVEAQTTIVTSPVGVYGSRESQQVEPTPYRSPNRGPSGSGGLYGSRR